MRVLHLIETTGPGGAETVFVDLAIGLSRRGHANFPVVHGPGWVADALRNAGIQPVMYSLGRTPDLSFIRAMLRLIRRERVDIIQTHLLGSGAYGALLGTLTGVPAVATFHGVNDLGPPGAGRVAKIGAIRLGARRAAFVSHALQRALAPALRLAPARTTVVYNGIDCDRFRPSPDTDLKRQLGLAADRILVGAVGNIRPAKDYGTFLRVAAELSRRSPRWHFVIVGDTTEHEALFDGLVRLRKELQLDDRVSFLGFQADVPRIMRGLDSFLCSSTSEGFSLAICQALASGVPVVSTRCGGPEEILGDDETGLFAAVGSAPGLADALQRIADDPALRSRLIQQGRSMVVSRFSIDAMVDGYEQIYRGERRA